MKRYILGLMMLVATQVWCAGANGSGKTPPRGLAARLQLALGRSQRSAERLEATAVAAAQSDQRLQVTTSRPAQPAQAQGGEKTSLQVLNELTQFLNDPANNHFYEKAIREAHREATPEEIAKWKKEAVGIATRNRKAYAAEMNQYGVTFDQVIANIFQKIISVVLIKANDIKCCVCMEEEPTLSLGCDQRNSIHLKPMSMFICKTCVSMVDKCPGCRGKHEYADIQVLLGRFDANF